MKKSETGRYIDEDRLDRYNRLNFIKNVKKYGLNNNPLFSFDVVNKIKRKQLLRNMQSPERHLGNYLVKKKIQFIQNLPFIFEGSIDFLSFYIPQNNIELVIRGQRKLLLEEKHHLKWRTKFLKNNGVFVRFINYDSLFDEHYLYSKMRSYQLI